MALSASTVWEVRTTGVDTNGGGFVTGSSGTDYSQQAAAQYALTGVTTAGANAICLSASSAAVMVGNICQITSGTNFTVGFYQILSVAVGVSFTLDRNCTIAAGAAGVVNIGGALLTIQQGLTNVSVASQVVYIKSGTYTITTALAPSATNAGEYQTRVIGYTTTRGDEGQPTVALSTAINGLNASSSGWTWENLIFSGAATGLIGVNISAAYNTFYNVKVTGFTSYGMKSAVNTAITFVRCEITSCSGTAAIDLYQTNSIYFSYIHNNTCPGIIDSQNGCNAYYCISANNTGASSDGISFSYQSSVIGCLCYGNGRDGLRFRTNLAFGIAGVVINNIFAKNGAYGLNWTSAATTTKFGWADYNAFWSNTTAARNNLTAGTHDVTITGTDPTNDPFTSKGTGDWSLNNTAGAGALLRAVGLIGILPGSSSTGYQDIGPLQHPDPGGAAGPSQFQGSFLSRPL